MRHHPLQRLDVARVTLGHRASGVLEPIVARLESVDGPIGGRADTGAKIQAALEEARVIFIEENGEGPGVRLRK